MGTGYGRLHVRCGGREFVAEGGEPLTVGRDPAADIHCEDRRVSRRHAVLLPGPDGWTIEDSQSTNGTFVEGRRLSRLVIDKDVVVHLGDARAGARLELKPLREQRPELGQTVTVGQEDIAEAARIRGHASAGRPLSWRLRYSSSHRVVHDLDSLSDDPDTASG